MGYYIDLLTVSIDDYRERLRNTDLLPSQKILHENMDNHFDTLKKCGITNLFELQKVLKTKKNLGEFCGKSGISEDYLTILRRDVNSFHPKAKNITEFPEVDPAIVEKLAAMGIKNTIHLFDRVRTTDERQTLSAELGCSEDVILDLARLTDLSRIKWVGPLFARMLIVAGYYNAKQISQANGDEINNKIKEINKDNKYYKANNIGIKDMELLVKVAADVTEEIMF